MTCVRFFTKKIFFREIRNYELRFSLYFYAKMRNFGAILCTIASGCRSIAFAHRSIASACRSIASAFGYSRWIFILFTKEQGVYINKVLASGRKKVCQGFITQSG